LALIEQESVALVRLGGRAEARVLTHRPEPPPVHRGVDPAREGKLARRSEGLARSVRGHVSRAVHRLQALARRLILGHGPARLLGRSAVTRIRVECSRACAAGSGRAWWRSRRGWPSGALVCRAAG